MAPLFEQAGGSAGAVTLGLSRISSVAASAEAAGPGWLSESEQGRLGRMRSARRRAEFLGGRLALRTLLAAVHGGNPLRDWSLDAPENAPPCLSSQPSIPVHLALSHSGDWLLCAVSAFPVGVDIEQLGAARDYAGLADMVCSPAERGRLQGCGPLKFVREFTTCWALKEAWLKARGEGIASRPLPSVETERASGAGNALVWPIEQAVLAMCLPCGDLSAITWAFHGSIQPGPPQHWQVRAG